MKLKISMKSDSSEYTCKIYLASFPTKISTKREDDLYRGTGYQASIQGCPNRVIINLPVHVIISYRAGAKDVDKNPMTFITE